MTTDKDRHSIAYQRGWDDCEDYYKDSILRADPGFYAWLDKLEAQRDEELNRELSELMLQQEHWAAQNADDEDQHATN